MYIHFFDPSFIYIVVIIVGNKVFLLRMDVTIDSV